MEKRELRINCALCDATGLSESFFDGYDRVRINAASILVTEQTAPLLARGQVSLNCANALTVPEGTRPVLQNGKFTIGPGEPAGEAAFLIVNGKLFVEPGAERALERYAGITVNGAALCPESLSAALSGNLTMNGSLTLYPDDAVVMPSQLTIDRAFILRAGAEKYFVPGRIVALEPGLDMARLAASGARLLARTAIVASSCLEALAPLLDHAVQVVEVPDGTLLIDDDAELTRGLVKKSGGRLYVNGDLTVPADAGALLAQLRYLCVKGAVLLPEALSEPFDELAADYDECFLYRGRLLRGRSQVTLDEAALAAPLTLMDCDDVTIAEAVPPALILDKLLLRDCAAVHCTEAQRSAVGLAGQDEACILTGPCQDEEDDANTVTINAATYKL